MFKLFSTLPTYSYVRDKIELQSTNINKKEKEKEKGE